MNVLQNENQFVQVMARIVRAITDETDGKISALQAQIKRLEAAAGELKYCGAWVEGQEYRRGNFATLGGIWHANKDTTARPGTNNDWALAMARPRDGRDAPLPEPPRVARTVRTR